MFSHYSSFIPLVQNVLVLFVWGTFVMLCVTVTNIYHFRSEEGGIISLHDPDVGYINIAYLPHSIQTVIWWNSSRHD